MLHTVKGERSYECDECCEILETGERSFDEAKLVFDNEGWRAVKSEDGLKWLHLCPKCASKA